MDRTVTCQPTACLVGQLTGGSAPASAGSFYTNTDATHGPVSAGAIPPIPGAPARLIKRGLILAFVALLTFAAGHTATKAVANLAHENRMQAKGW